MESTLIIRQLTKVIQDQVSRNFGQGRPTLRGVEAVREYAQNLLDKYMKELMKESPELQKEWPMGHPLKIYSKISLNTRSYEIVITTKDNPKGL